MTAKTLQLAVLLGVTNLSWFAFIILAGRTLSVENFGALNLAVSASIILGATLDTGLTSTLARWFSSRDLDAWDWTGAFRTILPRTAGLTVIAGAGLVIFVDLELAELCAVLVAGLAFVVLTAFGSGLLRAHARPRLGILAEKGFRLILPVVAVSLLALGSHDSRRWIGAYAAVLALGAVLVATVAMRKLPRGDTPLPSKFYDGALLFWLLRALYLVGAQWDRILIPRFLDMPALGQYAAVAHLMMGFELLSTALAYVLLPRFGRMQRLSMARQAVIPVALGAVGIAGYLLLGKPVLHLLYSGRYDHAAYLIAPLAAVNFIRMLYVIPSSVVATRFQRSHLGRLLGVNGVLIALHLTLLVVLLEPFGLYGAVAANGVVAVLRLGGVALLAQQRLTALDNKPAEEEAAR